MVAMYVNLIKNCRKTLEQVPETIRKEVEAMLDESKN